MILQEAQALKVGDKVTHKYLRTEWEVVEARLYKTNAGRVRHKLKYKQAGAILDENKLHLWEVAE